MSTDRCPAGPTWWSVALLLAFLCVAARATPAAEPGSSGATTGAIVIVPIEPPALVFGAGIRLETALINHTGAALSYSGSAATAEAGRALYALSGILLLAQLPAQARTAAVQAEAAEAQLNAAATWQPTVVMAQVAQSLLQGAGDTSVRISSQMRTVPGFLSQTRTVTMHKVYQPIADWYGTDPTPFSYAAPEVADGDLVLEVALTNYELAPGPTLLLLVSTRLVDPGSGKVRAKARKAVYPETADVATLFAGDATGFKQAFESAARQALEYDLRKLRLIP